MTIVGNFLFLDKIMKFTLELHLFKGSPCFTVLFSHHPKGWDTSQTVCLSLQPVTLNIVVKESFDHSSTNIGPKLSKTVVEWLNAWRRLKVGHSGSISLVRRSKGKRNGRGRTIRQAKPIRKPRIIWSWVIHTFCKPP